jgi:hypothetical protein
MLAANGAHLLLLLLLLLLLMPVTMGLLHQLLCRQGVVSTHPPCLLLCRRGVVKTHPPRLQHHAIRHVIIVRRTRPRGPTCR